MTAVMFVMAPPIPTSASGDGTPSSRLNSAAMEASADCNCSSLMTPPRPCWSVRRTAPMLRLY